MTVSTLAIVIFSALHIMTIADLSNSTSGSRPLNELMHLYTCVIYIAALQAYASEPNQKHFSLLLCVYSGFANTRTVTYICKTLPTTVVQCGAIFMMTSAEHSGGFLGALLTTYIAGIIIPEGKSARGTLRTFDTSHLISFRCSLYHPEMPLVCSPMNHILLTLIILQIMTSNGLMDKIYPRVLLRMPLKKIKQSFTVTSDLHSEMKVETLAEKMSDSILGFRSLNSPLRDGNATLAPIPEFSGWSAVKNRMPEKMEKVVTFSSPRSRASARGKRQGQLSRMVTQPMVV